MEKFDLNRARLRNPDYFKRFEVKGEPLSLEILGLPDKEELLVFEKNNHRYGFLLQELAYHHVAQGKIEDEPFMVSFCVVCHSAVGFTPKIENQTLHFSAGGLYDGIVLLIDDETLSYWNHITGKSGFGRSEGKSMELFNLSVTTVEAERKEKEPAKIWLSNPPLWARFFGWLNRGRINSKGFLPPGFGKTMRPIDSRLEKMTQGLGVVIGKVSRFYPKATLSKPIKDQLDDKELIVSIHPISKVPYAVDEEGHFPFQLFSRWYGFSATFPRCSVFRNEKLKMKR
ncbi:DUF3179 domain-containing (seleno)protein [Xanthovirga aplysinae]|uniref:DUF3179 domain-containing (seleno)protein n=1 Tax=Xanthovirga aplysinae TaxID=2529853 RepID=UPI0012BBA940|nr:DUF3179 domain-containing (seleno)protein [Xanthovirga aplysinae]MTI33572.1 DUF3179 domain-containing protein [Xanthovirga aplysinae]